jgi:hypothetical protein
MGKPKILIQDSAVGVTFGMRQIYIRDLVPGQPLRLIREPTNAFDSHAVAIWDTADHHLGYLSRTQAVSFDTFPELKGVVPAKVSSVGRCAIWGPYGFRFEYEIDGGEEEAADAQTRKRSFASIYA